MANVSRSPWLLHYDGSSCNGCDIEVLACLTPVYDETCGVTVKKGETIPALGHKTEVVGAKEATCTEDGYTGDQVCTVCGETVKKGETIQATGHHYKDGKCTDCGEKIGRAHV